jgi:predicted acylesterase/phospholipase RssA
LRRAIRDVPVTSRFVRLSRSAFVRDHAHEMERKACCNETRFALVLYGGVSLAVYMNGVTQEFLNLVRGAGVYKELAAIAHAQFVVDIASGSSAGGINAIFLGKALANGQSLDRLSRLWLEEASLSRLWNKERSPKSLLSGREMYAMLLRALEDMDESGGSGPLQPEMDVFITATDIQGLELPIQIADMSVVEKNHKNVFHMKFNSAANNDFSRAMNSFLAFAGRATSSFPAAFEPMRLEDSRDASREAPDAAGFFPAYVAAGADYSRRAFGDGGYLNNKPFNYALREIPRRVSDLPVRRMLMYIEPTPERTCGNSTQAPPGAIRNSIEALITLHQYETIREDLREALDRNRLIGRVREITNLVEQDVETWQRGGNPAPPRLAGPAYACRTLADEIHSRGPGYASYHRLKVRAVTDELTAILGPGVEAWRRGTYSEEDARRSESLFLLHFDLGYRQRRLRFLLAKLDEMDGSPELRRELSTISRNLADLHCRVHKLDFDSPASLRGALQEVMIPAAEQMEQCLAGHLLQRYFDRYEDYDQVTFPIFYETEVGETEPVEVFRISPLDARTVIDELSPAERRRKLAGTILFHFGAFLKREWRDNDMLWGRLDGAERIISSVLPPGSEDAARLIRDAHLAILREKFGVQVEAAQAEAVYANLKTGYEVDRRIGVFTALKLLARFAAVSFRMSISTRLAPFGKEFLSTLKACVLRVAR